MSPDPSGPGLREGRLRPEAAARCPWAPPEVWLPACTLAGSALRHAGSGTDPRAPQRALPDDAFEFRGGRPELALKPRARTRWSDHPRR